MTGEPETVQPQQDQPTPDPAHTPEGDLKSDPAHTPASDDARGAEDEQEPTRHEFYQQLILRRWKMIEGMLAESTRGLHNAIVDLKKLHDPHAFNEKNFAITGALLSMTEAVARTHNGFLDTPPEEPIIYAPKKDIIIAHR